MTSILSLPDSHAKAATNRAAPRAFPFFKARFRKDTVHRIGDILDNGRSDWRT